MNRLLLLLAALLLCCTAALSGGVTGQGGFEAVALSLDGKLISVGGQHRSIHRLDADSFEVKQRHYFGKRIGRLDFSRDGSRLFVEDETDTVSLFDRATGKVIEKKTGVSGMIVHHATGRVTVKDESDLLKPMIRWL